MGAGMPALVLNAGATDLPSALVVDELAIEPEPVVDRPSGS